MDKLLQPGGQRPKTKRPSKIDTTVKVISTYGNGNGNDAIIITNISNRYNLSPADIWKVLSSTNPYYTKKLEDINIDGKLHF